jgi:hypothetical protein
MKLGGSRRPMLVVRLVGTALSKRARLDLTSGGS